jgi:hypothetical protein
LPGDDGKQTASMLAHRENLVSISSDGFTEGSGFFAHRRLPMSKKK